MRSCEGCTLCCTVVAVPMLAKPAGTPCRHLCPDGCGIFADPARPVACHAYRCAWLFNAAWPDLLRPDRCHIVFEPFGDRCMAAAVDEQYPTAWTTGPGHAAITKLMQAGFAVVVVIGAVKHVLVPDGVTPASVWTQVERAMRTAWPQPVTPPI